MGQGDTCLRRRRRMDQYDGARREASLIVIATAPACGMPFQAEDVLRPHSIGTASCSWEDVSEKENTFHSCAKLRLKDRHYYKGLYYMLAVKPFKHGHFVRFLNGE